MKFNGKKPLILALLAATSIGLMFAGRYTDIFGLIFFGALLPLPLIFIRSTLGSPALLISLFALFLVACFTVGMNYAAACFTAAAVISFACGYAVISGKSFYDSELLCCVSTAVALGAAMLFLWVYTSQTIIDAAISETRKSLLELPDLTLKFLYRFVSVSASENAADLSSLNADALSAISTDTALNGLMRYITPSLTMLVPQLCSAGILLTGLLYYIIPRAVLKKLKYRVAAIPPFSMWSLPKHFGIWSVVIYLIALIGYTADLPNFEIVYAICYGAFNVVYSVQGLAFVDWLLLKKISSVPARVAILAVSFILLSVVDLYMWLGLIDQLLKLRKRLLINI